jgi:hypothetical protein
MRPQEPIGLLPQHRTRCLQLIRDIQKRKLNANRTPIRHSEVQTALCFYGGVSSMGVSSPKRKYLVD